MVWLRQLHALSSLLILGSALSAEAKTFVIIHQYDSSLCGSTEKLISYARKKDFSLSVVSNHRKYLSCYNKNPDLIKDHEFQKVSSAKEYRSYIDQLKAKINQGEFKPNDQVILQINTHGHPKQAGETTHSILAGDSWVSNDELKSIRDLMEEKGIKLAVMDGSCFSGESLNLATKKTCVITSQDRLREARVDNQTGGSFFEEFWAQPKNNLESTFLSVRTQVFDRSWKYDRPEISTSEHIKIRNLLDPIFFKWNHYDQEDQACLSPHFEKKLQEIAKLIKKSDRNLTSKLEKDFNAYQALVAEQKESYKKESKINQFKADGGVTDEYKKILNKQTQRDLKMKSIQNAIITEERRLYQRYYGSADPTPQNSNACRDFSI